MSAAYLLLVWLVLLLLIAAEILAAKVLGWTDVVPFLGLGAAGLVAFSFMRLRASSGLSQIFAFAGIFWLLVLLGLGSMDALTRRDYPVSQRTEP